MDRQRPAPPRGNTNPPGYPDDQSGAGLVGAVHASALQDGHGRTALNR